MPPLHLFISHVHEDKPIADALEKLVSQVFPPGARRTVKVDYSSNDAPGEGIRPGHKWLDWILDKVRATDACVVILTRDSLSAPWLTWEAGAVSGVAMATRPMRDRGDRQAPVIPMLFEVAADSIPAPLQHRQAVDGTAQEAVLKLLESLHDASGSSKSLTLESAKRPVAKFVDRVQALLRKRERHRPARLRLPDGPAPIYLFNVASGLTLEPEGGRIANRRTLVPAVFSGAPHQAWLLYPVGGGAFRIVTSNGAKCISIADDAIRPGALAILWDYVGHPSQHWRLIRHASSNDELNTVWIVNVASKLRMMPLPRYSPTARYVVQASEMWVNDQDWWLLAAPDVEVP